MIAAFASVALGHCNTKKAVENDLGVDLPLDRVSLAHDVSELVDLVYDSLQ